MASVFNALSVHFAAARKAPVVLMTACVTLRDAELEQLLSGYDCRITAPCREELRLLADLSAVPGYRRRAAAILEKAAAMPWSESDLSERPAPGALQRAVFVFGKDRISAESFAALAADRLPDAFAAVSQWSGKHCRVVRLCDAMHLVHPFARERVRQMTPDLDSLTCGAPRARFAHGSYGDVYRMPDGTLLKLFRFGPFRGSNAEKLRVMAMLYHALPEQARARAALPRNVVCDAAGACVGFQMDAVSDGATLSTALRGGMRRDRANAVIRSVLCVALELRCMCIWLRDISLRNFMLRRDGTVTAIDLDSAQFMDFLGVARPTADYACPALTADGSIRAEQQSYALASLVFHAVSGCPVHGLVQGTSAFDLPPRGPFADVENYTETCVQWWSELRAHDRERLYQWFTCRRPATVGELAEMLPRI